MEKIENKEEFAVTAQMTQILKERIGEEDAVSIAMESLVVNMNELAAKRDNTEDIKLSESIADILDETRVQMENLLIQVCGIIDKARHTNVSDKEIMDICNEIAMIQERLNTFN